MEMTVKQAAEQKGVTNNTVRRWLQEGRLKGYKIEGEYGKPEWRTTEEALYRMTKNKSSREECFGCSNKIRNNQCQAFIDINDPIRNEEGNCIAYC